MLRETSIDSGNHARALRAGCGFAIATRETLTFTVALALVAAGPVDATVYDASPTDYRRILRILEPGDELRLAEGAYSDGLPIHNIQGRPEAPITISGALSGQRSVLLGRPGNNTVSLRDAAHIVIRDLEIHGRGAFVDAIKAEGDAAFAHHIRLERLTIHGFAREQQAVGISTKCPAWNWEIVDNYIAGVGTGLYLGDSDGSAPFVGGLIEGNTIRDTIGYNLQIKHQIRRPELPGMPLQRMRTIIRHNRFSKAHGGAAGASARPNVLLGHFPLGGPGSDDEYVMYGNYFLQNPHEALFQGEGNLAIYANIFLNTHQSGFPAVAIQPHNDIPRRVRVFFNTVVHPKMGIRIVSGAAFGVADFKQVVVGNLLFADNGIEGGEQTGNVVRQFEEFDGRRAPLGENPCVPGILHANAQAAPFRFERFQDLPSAHADFHGRVRSSEHVGACAPQAQ
ncbi:MAG: hypothetical protein RLW61_18010 [Gammaproteobacteria bacterium]